MTGVSSIRAGDIARALAVLDWHFPRADVHTVDCITDAPYKACPETGQIYVASHLTGDEYFAAVMAAVSELLTGRQPAAVVPLARTAGSRRR